MDIRKILLITYKDFRLLLRDRPTLMIMFAAPLVLTFIVAAAFSGLTGSSSASPIQNIPVLVVNQDKGGLFGNFGKQMAEVFLNPPPGMRGLINASEISDPAEARAQVRQGKATAAIIIPENFSERLNAVNPNFGNEKVTVEVYRNVGSPISADIVVSMARGFLNSFTGGSIAAAAAIQASPALGLQAAAIAQEVGEQSFTAPPLTIAPIRESGQTGGGQGFNLLAYFAPAMAVFFLNFTMAFGAISILDEKANGTLQRMMVSPTERLTILVGKFAATFFSGVFQVVVLIIASAIIAPIIGFSEPIWGSNLPALGLLVVASVAASIGLGTIIPALAKDRQQANFIASAVMTLMGIMGGTFFTGNPSEPPLGVISMITPNYWATSGFNLLTTQGQFPVTNIVVLFGMFVVLFSVGATLYSRKLDV